MGYHALFDGHLSAKAANAREAKLIAEILSLGDDLWFGHADTNDDRITISVYTYAKWDNAHEDIAKLCDKLRSEDATEINGEIKITGEATEDVRRILVEDGHVRKQKGRIVYEDE